MAVREQKVAYKPYSHVILSVLNSAEIQNLINILNMDLKNGKKGLHLSNH